MGPRANENPDPWKMPIRRRGGGGSASKRPDPVPWAMRREATCAGVELIRPPVGPSSTTSPNLIRWGSRGGRANAAAPAAHQSRRDRTGGPRGPPRRSARNRVAASVIPGSAGGAANRHAAVPGGGGNRNVHGAAGAGGGGVDVDGAAQQVDPLAEVAHAEPAGGGPRRGSNPAAVVGDDQPHAAGPIFISVGRAERDRRGGRRGVFDGVQQALAGGRRTAGRTAIRPGRR